MAIFSVSGLHDAPVNTLLDKGLYHVQILSATPVESLKKGTPGIKLEFSVIQGPAQEATGLDPVGRHIFWTLWVSNDGPGRAIGLSRLAKLCRVCGIPQEDDLDLEAFVGKELIIKLGITTTQNGDEQEDVKDFRPYTA